MFQTVDPSFYIKDILADLGLSATIISWLSTVIMVVIVCILAWLADIITKAIVLKIVTVWVKRSKSPYDDKFLETKVFHRLSHMVPAIVIYFMASWALKNSVFWLPFVHKTTEIYMVGLSVLVVNAFIEAWHRIYLMQPISSGRSIKGYVQLLKIIAGIIGSLVVVSILFKLNIGKIVIGLTSVAAVLILVFKDTLLGLVASVQLSSNKMLRLGDWITIANHNIDGTVIDMSLHTVKIQNFDNTISTVPTYTLVSESFQNWKGMEDSGVRRIKRSVLIDVRSIKFLDAEIASRFKKMPLMDNYLKTHAGEIENILKGERTTLTNLAAFRAYLTEYLKNNKTIDQKLSLIVRNLAPAENGMPVEIYAFCKINQWSPYEEIQSEIFDFVFAVVNTFELKIFQNPSGSDIENIKK
jgi:miniconductance mechanosensitive channel